MSSTTNNRTALFLAFAFAVMADPVSSVAYASEAALRGLGGRLDLLVLTMVTVVGVIFLIAINYWWMLSRFPNGGPSRWASVSVERAGLAYMGGASQQDLCARNLIRVGPRQAQRKGALMDRHCQWSHT